MTDAVRLSKRVAALVPCSRSEAERYIEGGWVRVDGVVSEVPQSRVGPQQEVTLDPGASLLALAPVTLLFNRPVLAAPEAALPRPQDRWREDRSEIRVLQSQFRQLQALVPLPPAAGGLCVFSQDRRIVRKLTEDALVIEQELVVEVAGTLAEGGLQRLGQGLVWRGQPLPPAKVSWQSERRLRFAIKGIDPAQVPWMCAQVGLSVVSMRRLRLGRLPLAGLPPGQWRYLQAHERF